MVMSEFNFSVDGDEMSVYLGLRWKWKEKLFVFKVTCFFFSSSAQSPASLYGSVILSYLLFQDRILTFVILLYYCSPKDRNAETVVDFSRHTHTLPVLAHCG